MSDDITTEGDDCCKDDPVESGFTPAGDVAGILAFNLDTPEGERRMRECLDATKIKLSLLEFDQYLRSRIKYPEDTPSAVDLVDELESIRMRLWRICDDHCIRLDEE